MEKRIVLHFPKKLVDKPIVFRLVKDFSLEFNILKAEVNPKEEGLLVLELRGDDESYHKGIEFLKKETYSATRLNTYLNCPLKFYYRYVLGLREKEDLLEGPEAVHIGRFIHELLEHTFQRFLRKKPIIDEKFKKSFFYEMDKKFKRSCYCRNW